VFVGYSEKVPTATEFTDTLNLWLILYIREGIDAAEQQTTKLSATYKGTIDNLKQKLSINQEIAFKKKKRGGSYFLRLAT
jgi:hypothetical protein